MKQVAGILGLVELAITITGYDSSKLLSDFLLREVSKGPEVGQNPGQRAKNSSDKKKFTHELLWELKISPMSYSRLLVDIHSKSEKSA